MTALLLALCLAAPGAQHAPASIHPEVLSSEDFAPILWLAEDEPLHPMLPNAFAFDDAENDARNDGLVDVADPGEIAGTFATPAAELVKKKPFIPGRGRDPQQVTQSLRDVMTVVERAGATLPPATVLYYGPAAHGEPVATLKASPRDVAELRSGRVPAALRDAARKARVTIAADAAAATLHERIGDRDREWYLGEDKDGNDAIAGLTDEHRLAIRVGPACRFEYWFYYLYDQGLNGHLHDSEHAFVFVEPLVRRGEHDLCRSTPYGRITGVATTPPLVRAVVGAGHEAHTANNILVASPERPRETASAVMEARHNLVFPAGLPFHMPILVELGKHASAPDRSFDGRFDFGMDANVFPESVWGTRDVQAGNVGRMKLGRFDNWFSFPRSERGILMPAGWRDRPEYDAAFPTQIDFLKTRAVDTYRLVPVTDLRDLYELLAAVDQGARGAQDVAAFLQRHRDCFWAATTILPDPVVVSPEALAAMIETWTVLDRKRDVWRHDDHRNPDGIFKLSMFRTIGLGAATRVDSGTWAVGPAVQINQVKLPRKLPLVGGSMLFNDSTLHVQALFRRPTDLEKAGASSPAGDGPRRLEFDLGVLVNSYRGRYFGWYVAFSSADRRVGGGFAASVPSVPGFRAGSMTARIGLLGDPFRGRVPLGAVFSLEFNAGLVGAKHPLSY